MKWHNPLGLDVKTSTKHFILPLKRIVKANVSLSVSKMSHNFYTDIPKEH